jgi:hypothetical protein
MYVRDRRNTRKLITLSETSPLTKPTFYSKNGFVSDGILTSLGNRWPYFLRTSVKQCMLTVWSSAMPSFTCWLYRSDHHSSSVHLITSQFSATSLLMYQGAWLKIVSHVRISCPYLMEIFLPYTFFYWFLKKHSSILICGSVSLKGIPF